MGRRERNMEEYLTEKGQTERELSELLPYRLVSAAIKCAAVHRSTINEVRLREGQPLCITSNGKNFVTPRRVSREDIDYTLRKLCSNSLYSHAETIKEGFITSKNGVRAGICGRAVTDGGNITAVTEVTSLAIRFPRRAYGAADNVYAMLKKRDFKEGVLIYSRPGIGKTTLLRELACLLSTGEDARRTAIIDTRCELSAGFEDLTMADVLNSYPRGKGIEIAVRTLSPQYIICDEIGNASEAEAILEAAHSGVNIAASAHGESFEQLMRSPYIARLWEAGIFGICLGLLSRDPDGKYLTEISYFDKGNDMILCEECLV